MQDTTEICFDPNEFFAPMETDAIDGLIGQYQLARTRIDEVAGLVAGELGSVISFFIEGNAGDERLHRSIYVEKLFRKEGAIAALNAHYWSKALALTDVYDLMPQSRRDQWHAQIQNPLGVKSRVANISTAKPDEGWEIEPLPDFQEETVRATLMDLINARSRFFSERVDGIFRSLSHQHVTNCPQGFRKRMIIAGMFNFYSGGHATSNWSRMGVVNDLRCVIAKFMGRDDPHHYASNSIIENARRYSPGQWINLDGGALRIRVYLKGTAHIEIHPDMAWRLNAVLAAMHPAAIPAEFRSPPKSKVKQWELMHRPLPFSVLRLLESMEPARRRVEHGHHTGLEIIPKTLTFSYLSDTINNAARAEAESVLQAIGGVLVKQNHSLPYWQFDYEPKEIIDEIVASGCIPEHKSHQFYPTPEPLARRVVELAEVGVDDICLEPQAGQGGLAQFMPNDRTTCVEINELNCDILRAKGFGAIQADFLTWHECHEAFDRIIMNPPFSDGRWQEHVRAAATKLKPGGRLVAILPSSARNHDLLGDCSCRWHGPYENEFPGTSVHVCILVADKPPMQG